MSDLLKAIVAFGYIYKKVNNTYVDVNTGKLLLLTEDKIREGLELYEQQQKMKSLRIFDYMDSSADPLTQDFSIVGLIKKAPHYDRGKKVKAEYHDPVTNDLVVEKIFKDVLDENGKLRSLEGEFRYYCKDGSLGLVKIEVLENLSKAKSKTIQRMRRERSIDFLLSEGEDTPIEVLMEELVDYYEDVKNLYVKYGKSDFADAMVNEQDPLMLHYLTIRVPFTSDNLYTITIRDAILYQVHAITEEEMITRLQPINPA